MSIVGRVLRIALVLLGGSLAVAALFVVYFYYQLGVRYPKLNERNLAIATEWNLENWENGHALEVTLVMDQNRESGVISNSATILCTPKFLYLPGGLSSTPSAGLTVFSTGPDSLSVPFGDNLILKADIRSVCQRAFIEFDPEFGTLLKPRDYYLRLEVSDPPLTCIPRHGTREMTTGNLRMPYISRVEPIPMRDLATEAEMTNVYAYDPLNRPKDWDGSLSYRNHVRWNKTRRCWTKPRSDTCEPLATELCGAPLR